jgi:hypothetical protein
VSRNIETVQYSHCRSRLINTHRGQAHLEQTRSTTWVKIAVAGQYGPVSEAPHGYDERVDVESAGKSRGRRSLRRQVVRCGQGALNFPANSPTRTREIMTDLGSSTLPDHDTWRSRLLNYVDEHAREIVADLAGLVRMPSVSGSDNEIAIQHVLADRMSTMDLDVDAWQISLEETLAEPDFPGVEVDRSEAWGVVGRVAGRGSGPPLMLNAHVDVVPPGDLRTWEGADPFNGRVTGDTVEGRGACDMKAGLVASLWAVRGLTELKVPLRGDLVLATVVGEEDGGLGTYALLRRGWRAEACVIPEPTSLDIAPASAGALTFRITVPGAATHASRRLSGVSAIEKFIPIFSALREGTERDQAPTRDAVGAADSHRDPQDSRWGVGIECARHAQRRGPHGRRYRRRHLDRPARARGNRRRRLPGR